MNVLKSPLMASESTKRIFPKPPVNRKSFNFVPETEHIVTMQGNCLRKLNQKVNKVCHRRKGDKNRKNKNNGGRLKELEIRIENLERLLMEPSQLIVIPVKYHQMSDPAEHYHLAYKHYFVNPYSGQPVMGHPKALAGYNVFYTAEIGGESLDVSEWDDVQPIIS